MALGSINLEVNWEVKAGDRNLELIRTYMLFKAVGLEINKETVKLEN